MAGYCVRGALFFLLVNGAGELAWVYTVDETGIKRLRIVSGCWSE